MSHELPRSIRTVYDELDCSETGQFTRAEVDTLVRALQGRGNALTIAAVWSAARALVFPQVPPDSIEACARALRALRDEFASKSHAVSPTGIEPLLQSSPTSDLWALRQTEARRCLGHALLFCIDRSPARFQQVIQSLTFAQGIEFEEPPKSQAAWIGWLDDVVSRSDGFSVESILELTARAVRGTIESLPAWFQWEGTGDEAQRLHVWIADGRTRKLQRTAMSLEPLKLVGRELRVTVAPIPDLVRDPMRIEYLFEHWVHRRFLNGLYYGRYEQIQYHCAATGERWQARA
jgi:hypothetical protein